MPQPYHGVEAVSPESNESENGECNNKKRFGMCVQRFTFEARYNLLKKALSSSFQHPFEFCENFQGCLSLFQSNC